MVRVLKIRNYNYALQKHENEQDAEIRALRLKNETLEEKMGDMKIEYKKNHKELANGLVALNEDLKNVKVQINNFMDDVKKK